MRHLFKEKRNPSDHSAGQQKPDTGGREQDHRCDDQACLCDIDFVGRYLHTHSVY